MNTTSKAVASAVRRARKLLRDANTNRLIAQTQLAAGCTNIAELHERTAALYELQARAALKQAGVEA